MARPAFIKQKCSEWYYQKYWIFSFSDTVKLHISHLHIYDAPRLTQIRVKLTNSQIMFKITWFTLFLFPLVILNLWSSNGERNINWVKLPLYGYWIDNYQGVYWADWKDDSKPSIEWSSQSILSWRLLPGFWSETPILNFQLSCGHFKEVGARQITRRIKAVELIFKESSPNKAGLRLMG